MRKFYTLVEFAAAAAFVIGSVLYFYPSEQVPATWFFLVGSVLFAARPTVRVQVLRENHLARLPLPGDWGARFPRRQHVTSHACPTGAVGTAPHPSATSSSTVPGVPAEPRRHHATRAFPDRPAAT